jgi:hypothetical protein
VLLPPGRLKPPPAGRLPKPGRLLPAVPPTPGRGGPAPGRPALGPGRGVLAAGPRPPRPGGGGIGLPDGDRGGRWAPGGGGIGLPDGEMGGPPGAGRPGAPPAPARVPWAGGLPPGVGPPGPDGRPGAPVRGGIPVRGGGPERGGAAGEAACEGIGGRGEAACEGIGGRGGAACEGIGGRGGAGSGGRRTALGADDEGPLGSPGRLVTSRGSVGRGMPRGGGGMGGALRGAPNGVAGAGRDGPGSRGGRSAAGRGAAGSVIAGVTGAVTGSGCAVSSGGASIDVAAGTSAGTSLVRVGALVPTVTGASGSALSPGRPLRPRTLVSAGSSGCLSRRSPSRSAFRRTRSAWASSMLDEWLVTPMPRSRQRSSASLLVRPSSRPSSYTRIFLAKSYVNPFLGRRRRRSLSLSSHVLEWSFEAPSRLPRSPEPGRPDRTPGGEPPVRDKSRRGVLLPRCRTTRRPDREPLVPG